MGIPTAIANRDGMVITTGATDLVVYDDSMYGDVVGGGFENVTSNDIAIPYIRILQSSSHEVKRGDPKRIEGAVEGDIFNTGTSQVFKGDLGITVIPCAFKKTWFAYGPRSADGKRGDFVAMLSGEPTGTRVGRSIIMDNGNEAMDVADHYVVLVDGTTWAKALIRMRSTQIKASRFWLGRMQGIQWIRNNQRVTPPSFSHMYRLTTGLETKGDNSWMGWVIGQEQKIMDVQLAIYAKEFYHAVMSGLVQVVSQDDDAEAAPSTSVVNEDNPPF